MTRKSTRPYLYVIGLILLMMSIPRGTVEGVRGTTVAMIAPIAQLITLAQSSLTQLTHEEASPEEVEKLKLQNELLIREIERLKEHMHYRTARLPSAIPARVIFRSPSSWNSSLWINVGQSDYPALVKNSPVVVGSSIVGVIDYVGNHQSRVHLITDSGLSPSVRASRGQIQSRMALENLTRVIFYLQHHPDLPNSQQLIQDLSSLRKNLSKTDQTWALAKGELHGSSKPLWRSSGTTLKGIGFNYDFADEEGPARDLRTGEPINHNQVPAMPLLKVNDLLVTTGMDGIFPPGLRVAEITKVDLLREGDYYYTLEAKPTAGNLDDLSLVFVISPLGYDVNDQPPRIGD